MEERGFCGVPAGQRVEMGERVVERRERWMGWWMERMLSISRGPKAVRAWKEGKSTMP